MRRITAVCWFARRWLQEGYGLATTTQRGVWGLWRVTISAYPQHEEPAAGPALLAESATTAQAVG